MCLTYVVYKILQLIASTARQMPQNDYMDLHKKRFGERLDAEEKRRKK